MMTIYVRIQRGRDYNLRILLEMLLFSICWYIYMLYTMYIYFWLKKLGIKQNIHESIAGPPLPGAYTMLP